MSPPPALYVSRRPVIDDWWVLAVDPHQPGEVRRRFPKLDLQLFALVP